MQTPEKTLPFKQSEPQTGCAVSSPCFAQRGQEATTVLGVRKDPPRSDYRHWIIETAQRLTLAEGTLEATAWSDVPWTLTRKLKSKVFKYAKWPSKWLTNKSLVLDLMKKRRSLIGFLIDFLFCRLAETTVSGFSISHVTFPKWRQSGESVRLPS